MIINGKVLATDCNKMNISDGAMLRAAVAALACLSVARASPSEPHQMRLYAQNSYNTQVLQIQKET